jgi:DNA-binding NarL/FixJ family response regulator
MKSASAVPSPPAATRRIVIVEDQTAIREMMKGAVEALEGYHVIAHAGDLGEAGRLCRQQQPDILVLDLTLPSGSGFDLIPGLRATCPRTRVVIFSGHLRPGIIRRALLSGAHGFVEKTAPLGEFHDALRAAGSGQVYFSRFASEQVRQLVQREPRGPHRTVRLTEREKGVLRLIAEGLGSKQISGALGLSRHTIGNVRARLARKTGLRGVARLSRYAVQIGLISDAVEGAADPV